MAPERDTRPEGLGLPGTDAVSREEIRRRINTLYDRAETDTGNYNATRAMTTGTRRPAAPLRATERRQADPALDTVARQWFDVARAKLGPTVAAVLPADRMPDPPAAARPARPAELPAAVPAPRLELEAPVKRVPELTAGPVAALSATPGSRRDDLPALTASYAPPALPAALPASAPASAPATKSRQSALRTTKEQIREKLTAARELLSRQTALRSTPPAALEAAPTAEALWSAPAQQDPLRGEGGAGVGWLTQPAISLDTGIPVDSGYTNAPVDTGQFSVPLDGALLGTEYTTGQFSLPADTAYTNSPVDTGQFSLPADTAYTNSPIDTGQFSLPADMAYTNSPIDTGQFSLPADMAYTNSPVENGQFNLPLGTGYANTPVDTGQFSVATVPVGVPEATYSGKAAKALDFARAQIGRPCLWGATGPESYDCSSLTQAAWKAAGVALPRTAIDQARTVAAIPLTELQPGDLIFFYGDVSHVGLCTGNGTMIHAPGPGASVREESIFFAGQTAIHSAARPA
ncbi:C40 family peptidase [Streptomyces sp. NPDC002928]|uniref:C40 family peptidase n=1 Tax=Streptomyces sp. NPDC002928 TaxID=3154440 RepID=UPI0033B4BD46